MEENEGQLLNIRSKDYKSKTQVRDMGSTRRGQLGGKIFLSLNYC